MKTVLTMRTLLKIAAMSALALITEAFIVDSLAAQQYSGDQNADRYTRQYEAGQYEAGQYTNQNNAEYNATAYPASSDSYSYDNYGDSGDSNGYGEAASELTGSYGGRSSTRGGHHPSFVDGTVEGADYRQPVAIEKLSEATAMVGCKLSGEIYEFDLQNHQLQLVYNNTHKDVHRSWGDLQRLSSNSFAAADVQSDCVAIFTKLTPDGGSEDAQPVDATQSGEWTLVAELDAPGHPNRFAWDEESQILYATGQWSQRLYRWRQQTIQKNPQQTSQDATGWEPLPTVDLPLHGGQLLLLPGHSTILIADAFGRAFVLIDDSTGRLLKQGEFYGHNITSLAAIDDEQTILFPHQLLNEFTPTVQNDITWGGLLSNSLRWIQTDRMMTETGRDMFRKGKFYPLGTSGNGAGDPTAMCLTANGLIGVTLGGTDRLAYSSLDELDFRQVTVGRHPVDCIYANDDTQIVVVNQFSDTISVVDIQTDQVQHIALGPLRKPTMVEEGERLFFHSRLAHDGWMSCHSCHSQGHTNGLTNDNITDGSYGTPKRILSLLGQAETGPYSWGGSIDSLETQVAHSIEFTLASDNPVDSYQVNAIANFIRTLPAPPSLLAARGSAAASNLANNTNDLGPQHPKESNSAGRAMFESLGCTSCHAGANFTTPDTYDVGIVDREGMRLYNPPSLIGLSQRQRALFHNGSARSIRDVLESGHQLPRELTSDEIQTLVGYLSSL